MLTLYLFALIVGGGLLAFSLIWGDADGSDVEVGSDLDAEVDFGVEDGLELGGGSLVDAHEGDWSILRGFLSVRTVLHLLAGFGATGTILELFTGAPAGVALTWAIATGVVAAVLAGLIYGWVRSSGSGDVSLDPAYLVGATATVLLPVVQGRRGKVIALQGGREVELLARMFSDDDPDCPRGSEVVIVDIVGETALVAPLPSISSGSGLE